MGAESERELREKGENGKGEDVIGPEVCVDECDGSENDSDDFIWYWDEDGEWERKRTGKGERLIILHEMTKNGWLPTPN